MRIQVIQHDVPSGRVRVAGDQPLEMSEAIFLASGWTPGWFDHLAGGDIEIDEPGQGSMPDILKLTAEHMAWLHRQIRMFAFQSLYPGQFIHADRSFSLFGSLCSLGIDLASLYDFLLPLGVFFLGQPIAEPVRLKAPFFRSRAACRGEICVTIPRALSSSEISRPVHWLMGRPVFAGASQAKAAI